MLLCHQFMSLQEHIDIATIVQCIVQCMWYLTDSYYLFVGFLSPSLTSVNPCTCVLLGTKTRQSMNTRCSTLTHLPARRNLCGVQSWLNLLKILPLSKQPYSVQFKSYIPHETVRLHLMFESQFTLIASFPFVQLYRLAARVSCWQSLLKFHNNNMLVHSTKCKET